MWVVSIMAGELGQVLAAFDTREEANIFAKETSGKYVVESCKIKYSEKESCETCKHRNDDDHGEVYEQFCEKCNWGTDSRIKIENMKCNEWEAR